VYFYCILLKDSPIQFNKNKIKPVGVDNILGEDTGVNAFNVRFTVDYLKVA
jgi:hypothetical protein